LILSLCPSKKRIKVFSFKNINRYSLEVRGMTAEQKEPKWRCTICGYIAEGAEPPDKCPTCSASSDKFELVGAPAAKEGEEKKSSANEADAELVDYLAQWSRSAYEKEEKFTTIQKLALTGKSEISPMGTRRPFPGLETILFKGVQFSRFPLNEDEPVSTKTVIGPNAAYPLELDIPFYVSHMSFGALSREAKVALAMGASRVGTATCSGEGGMLPEEREHASRYIYEIGTAPFSHNEDYIKQADAVEIKFGQAAKPGMGGHLPGEKVTTEIAKVRNIPAGEDFISPNRQPGINSPDDLKKMIDDLRALTKGKPIGVKFAAGHVEEDLRFVLAADPDFITIDCRGGATGAAPNFIRDNVCLPAVYAIRKARRYLDSVGSKVTFCVTGGFRDSTDIAKALALGADAVALASASLLAIGCQQYRICNTGLCPVGITTQDEELRSRFSIPHSVKRFVNFYDATRVELEVLSRINGRSDVHDLCLDDIVTISNEISTNTDIPYA